MKKDKKKLEIITWTIKAKPKIDIPLKGQGQRRK
jgi:hypothetical protein